MEHLLLFTYSSPFVPQFDTLKAAVYARISRTAVAERTPTLDSLELARTVAELLEDKKAENILVLDLRPDRVIADFFVIATGTSDRNLKALSEHVRLELKDKHDTAPASFEGIAESGWVLLDYGEVIVHLFLEDRRQYYDLEGLWRGESKVVLSIK